jgi:quinol monooxygenase YgiN
MKLLVTGGTGKAQSAAAVGCRTYELSAQLTDPLTLRLFEEWDDAEALSVHFQTPHFKVFSAALPDLLATAPSFLRYEIAAVGPLR